MRHPYRVSIVATAGNSIVTVAKRSTLEKANAQAAELRKAIGTFNREGIPLVHVTDLREGIDTAASAAEDD
jgi:hypothetical protein